MDQPALDQEAVAVPEAVINPATDPNLELVYSCRKCRVGLFRPQHIAEHEVGRHRFSSHRIHKDVAAHGSALDDGCTSFFLVEALKWMEAASEDVEGKLCCHSCGTRVGVLKWAGSQCSCGTWVTPAIQLYKKSLDERYVAKAAGGGAGSSNAAGGAGAAASR